VPELSLQHCSLSKERTAATAQVPARGRCAEPSAWSSCSDDGRRRQACLRDKLSGLESHCGNSPGAAQRQLWTTRLSQSPPVDTVPQGGFSIRLQRHQPAMGERRGCVDTRSKKWILPLLSTAVRPAPSPSREKRPHITTMTDRGSGLIYDEYHRQGTLQVTAVAVECGHRIKLIGSAGIDCWAHHQLVSPPKQRRNQAKDTRVPAAQQIDSN